MATAEEYLGLESTRPDERLASATLPAPPAPGLAALGSTAISPFGTPTGSPAVAEFLNRPDVKRFALEAGLSMAGSLAGGPIAAPAIAAGQALPFLGPVLTRLGPLAARALLAATGGGIGSLAAEIPDPTPQPLQTAKRAAAINAAGEVAGAGLGKVVEWGAAPVARKVMPAAQGAIDLVRRAGGVFPPASATTSRGLDIIQNVAEKSLIGGGRVSRTKERAVQIIDDALKSFEVGFHGNPGMAREALGDVIQQTIEGDARVFRAAESAAYDQVDQVTRATMGTRQIQAGPAQPTGLLDPRGRPLMGAIPMKTQQYIAAGGVDLTAAKVVAARLKQQAEITGSPQLAHVASLVDSLPTISTFKDAGLVRSALLEMRRTVSDPLANRTIGGAKLLGGAVDEAMERAGSQLPPNAITAWRTANAFSREGHQKFNDELIKRIVDSKPEAVVDIFLRVNKPGTVRDVRNIINNPTTWQAVQGEFIHNILTASRPVGGGPISGNGVLLKLRSMGDATLQEIFPAAQHQAIEKFARMAAFIQEKQAKGLGTMAVQLAQPGAAIEVARWLVSGTKSVLSGTAATVLVAPGLMGWLMTTRNGARWLTEGLRIPAGTPEAIRHGTRIMLLAQDAIKQHPEFATDLKVIQ